MGYACFFFVFFHSRSGSRLSGSGGGMYTSGEESSAEWSCAQLDTDEQPRAEERLVRSKAPQLKLQIKQGKLRILQNDEPSDRGQEDTCRSQTPQFSIGFDSI